MPSYKLIDRFNRHLNYLRISVTDRCNLHCKYCMPKDQIPKLAHEEILRYEEILQLVTAASQMGVNKVRVTGGEPLVRKGLTRFLSQLTAIPELEDVSLTTNGVLLAAHLGQLKAAGIKRLNISLDTLSPGKFAQITGKKAFHQVWQALMRALEMEFAPIKLNVVALEGTNEEEISAFARLTFRYPFHVRFIEYMPIGACSTRPQQRLLAPEIKRRLREIGRLLPVDNAVHDGPAERYRFENAMGEIGLIRPMTHHFCSRCNRLRLTADGKLRTCLLNPILVDVKEALRSGCSDEALKALLQEAARQKPLAHHLGDNNTRQVQGQMCAIGG